MKREQEGKGWGPDLREVMALNLRDLSAFVEMLDSCSKKTLEDFKLYIDTLERYSSELDQTLTSIFQQAQEMAEEEQKKQEELRKKQEELRKKEPPYRT